MTSLRGGGRGTSGRRRPGVCASLLQCWLVRGGRLPRLSREVKKSTLLSGAKRLAKSDDGGFGGGWWWVRQGEVRLRIDQRYSKSCKGKLRRRGTAPRSCHWSRGRAGGRCWRSALVGGSVGFSSVVADPWTRASCGDSALCASRASRIATLLPCKAGQLHGVTRPRRHQKSVETGASCLYGRSLPRTHRATGADGCQPDPGSTAEMQKAGNPGHLTSFASRAGLPAGHLG